MKDKLEMIKERWNAMDVSAVVPQDDVDWLIDEVTRLRSKVQSCLQCKQGENMSYFSHNPEAYDEIEVKGIARKLGRFVTPQSSGDEERTYAEIEEMLVNLQNADDPHAKEVYHCLADWAHEEINDETSAYFDKWVP